MIRKAWHRLDAAERRRLDNEEGDRESICSGLQRFLSPRSQCHFPATAESHGETAVYEALLCRSDKLHQYNTRDEEVQD